MGHVMMISMFQRNITSLEVLWMVHVSVGSIVSISSTLWLYFVLGLLFSWILQRKHVFLDILHMVPSLNYSSNTYQICTKTVKTELTHYEMYFWEPINNHISLVHTLYISGMSRHPLVNLRKTLSERRGHKRSMVKDIHQFRWKVTAS